MKADSFKGRRMFRIEDSDPDFALISRAGDALKTALGVLPNIRFKPLQVASPFEARPFVRRRSDRFFRKRQGLLQP